MKRPALPITTASSVSQSIFFENRSSNAIGSSGPTTQSAVLTKNSGSLPLIGVLAFSALWSL